MEKFQCSKCGNYDANEFTFLCNSCAQVAVLEIKKKINSLGSKITPDGWWAFLKTFEGATQTSKEGVFQMKEFLNPSSTPVQ